MYESPTWVEVIQDAAIVLAFFTALVGSVIAAGRFFILKPLQHYIDERTPKNGGQSLKELHQKFDQLDTRIARMERELVRIDEELEEHVDR